MLVGILVALAGSVAMSLGDVVLARRGLATADAAALADATLYGNLLALVGALMAAVYFLAGRSLRQRVSLVPYVVVVYLVCTVALGALAVSRGHPLGPAAYPPHEWLLFLGMAVGPGVFGHTVLNWALAHVESSVVSVSLLGEPVGSTLLAYFLLGETPTATTVVGGLVVLAGIVVTARARER